MENLVPHCTVGKQRMSRKANLIEITFVMNRKSLLEMQMNKLKEIKASIKASLKDNFSFESSALSMPTHLACLPIGSLR